MEHNQKIMPAKVGDMIEWINPKYYITLQGLVLFVYENSVGVQILNYGHNIKKCSSMIEQS